jgi:hypothetical protein
VKFAVLLYRETIKTKEKDENDEKDFSFAHSGGFASDHDGTGR